VRPQVIDAGAADLDRARVLPLEPGDDPQQRRLAAARGTDQVRNSPSAMSRSIGVSTGVAPNDLVMPRRTSVAMRRRFVSVKREGTGEIADVDRVREQRAAVPAVQLKSRRLQRERVRAVGRRSQANLVRRAGTGRGDRPPKRICIARWTCPARIRSTWG
jgi:hypothetical protein